MERRAKHDSRDPQGFDGQHRRGRHNRYLEQCRLFGPEAVPITQTAGTGLTGTFRLNSPAMGAGNPLATGLAQDTNPANVAGNFNYARFNGLMADGSGNITLNFGISQANANDFAINGFQLVQQVPEPSSALLGGLGLLALLRRRR